jgi:hypothetical protein
VSRSVLGEFTGYLNDEIVDVTGGSGTNPVTDLTFTGSQFMILDFDAGDEAILADVKGEMSFKKQFGVVVPT